MDITTEQIAEVEAKVTLLKEIISKSEELLKDIKVCTGQSTKALIFSAVKKQLASITAAS